MGRDPELGEVQAEDEDVLLNSAYQMCGAWLVEDDWDSPQASAESGFPPVQPQSSGGTCASSFGARGHPAHLAATASAPRSSRSTPSRPSSEGSPAGPAMEAEGDCRSSRLRYPSAPDREMLAVHRSSATGARAAQAGRMRLRPREVDGIPAGALRAGGARATADSSVRGKRALDTADGQGGGPSVRARRPGCPVARAQQTAHVKAHRALELVALAQHRSREERALPRGGLLARTHALDRYLGPPAHVLAGARIAVAQPKGSRRKGRIVEVEEGGSSGGSSSSVQVAFDDGTQERLALPAARFAWLAPRGASAGASPELHATMLELGAEGVAPRAPHAAGQLPAVPTVAPPACLKASVGRQLLLRSPACGQWWRAVVLDVRNGLSHVLYEDGEDEWVSLQGEDVRWVPAAEMHPGLPAGVPVPAGLGAVGWRVAVHARVAAASALCPGVVTGYCLATGGHQVCFSDGAREQVDLGAAVVRWVLPPGSAAPAPAHGPSHQGVTVRGGSPVGWEAPQPAWPAARDAAPCALHKAVAVAPAGVARDEDEDLRFFDLLLPDLCPTRTGGGPKAKGENRVGSEAVADPLGSFEVGGSSHSSTSCVDFEALAAGLPRDAVAAAMPASPGGPSPLGSPASREFCSGGRSAAPGSGPLRLQPVRGRCLGGAGPPAPLAKGPAWPSEQEPLDTLPELLSTHTCMPELAGLFGRPLEHAGLQGRSGLLEGDDDETGMLPPLQDLLMGVDPF